jgi:hypothetical protein|tara:strand:+ start:6380 stop:6703 length:324 start_codon:yes stop_codon:yes gene_type:complete
MGKYKKYKEPMKEDEGVKDKIVDALIPEANGVTESDLQRRLHFAARFLVTVCQFCLLILMLFLLFYQIVPDSSRDLVSAITGMLVISQKDAVQYWFGHHRIGGDQDL